MKLPKSALIFLLLSFCFFSEICKSKLDRVLTSEIHAASPPRGWNSYDSFSWTIDEQQFLDNAQLVSQKLKSSGYEYVVVDYLWYRRKVAGAGPDSLGFDVIDEWGRMLPDPIRWPSSSSTGEKGFSEVARKVHSMGLKFGIHVMKGISTQAVNANTPIMDITTGGQFQQSGRNWTAQDIGIKERACAWMPHGFMSVNTSLDAGKAFLRSLYKQYSEWGVDFVKLDCVFGEDLDLAEIKVVSEAIEGQNSTVLFSLSPGKQATPEMATSVSGLVNMYRVTADDWDTWPDVASHFDVARDFSAANLTGAAGLLGKSWPDLDMLPLGWLTDPASNEGPHRACRLTLDEQKTQVTLWSIAKSPLMFGGDMRNLDHTTYRLLTEPTLLQINSDTSNNKEFANDVGIKITRSEPNWLVLLWRKMCRILAQHLVTHTSNGIPTGVRAWVATGSQDVTYVALFNLNEVVTVISANLRDLDMALPGRNIKEGSCKCKEIWSGKDLGVVQKSLKTSVNPHGVALFVLNCNKP
uniref:Alpha-galactosidase n=2 Tax=Kalanchoe fedtschenkoi TaxID=63787 RepID=A0A7N0UNU3_KALFE